LVTLEDIRAAREQLHGVAVRTPLVRLHSAPAGRQIFLKLESLQPVGSFKLRGAYNKIVSLSAAERSRGVITYSSGNHAQGVAYAARALGVKAIVVMPNNAPQIKIASTRGMGAEVVFVGPASSERQAKAEALAQEHGYAVIPPYNDEAVIAGQGTIALEILEAEPSIETIVAPIGGGGLISGIAAGAKLSSSRVRVVGVEPELAGDAAESFRTGKLSQWSAEQTSRTLADGLRTQSVGPINFEHMQKFLDDVVTVPEPDIRRTMAWLLYAAKIVAEASGAIAPAAALWSRAPLGSGNVAVVVSGGNVEPALLAEVAARESDLAAAEGV
jgi:threonine dehydratase